MYYWYVDWFSLFIIHSPYESWLNMTNLTRFPQDFLKAMEMPSVMQLMHEAQTTKKKRFTKDSGGADPPVRIVFWSRKPGVLTGQGKLANSYRDCFTLFFSWLKPWWNTVEAQFHHFYGETMVTPTFFLLGVVFALNAKKTTIAVQHCHIRLPRYHRGTQWYS